jgi:LmbE family N-acetylglucosaminyl deacetylase
MIAFINTVKSRIKKLILKFIPLEIIPFIKHLRSKGRYLTKNSIVLNKITTGTILIIAPHPDDEIIGMGGVLSMHLDAKSKITVLYLTDGRHENPNLGFSKTKMAEIRRKEAESIGKQYFIKQVFWDIEDTCLTNDEETISRMIKLLEDIRPEIIYLPSFFDYHCDHFAANQILAESLKKISNPQANVVCYEVWDNIPYPNYIVDISPYFKKKKEMLNYYETPLKTVDYIKLCDHRNALHYTLYVNSKTSGHAEAFCYLNSEAYQELYNDYFHALQKFGSNLPSHIKKPLVSGS